MDNFGLLSVLPPVIAIILAIRTRKVILSLLTGIFFGWLIISSWNPFRGLLATAVGLMKVFTSESSLQTILFTLFIGSLIAFIQRSGGVEGFILKVTGNLTTVAQRSVLRKKVQFLAALTGLLIFVESNISVLTVGAIYRPLTDKLKISREKLAYIADSTSAPSSILIPLNAWGGFIMGLLVLQGISHPFPLMLRAIPLNIYPILAVITVFIVISTGKDIGPMRRAERRAIDEGKPLRDGARPMVSSSVTQMEPKPGIKPQPVNMIIPISLMVIIMPVMLTLTGWNKVDILTVNSFFEHIGAAISNSSGSASVLYSVLTALVISTIYYLFRGVFSPGEISELILKGMSGMITLALLMVMAFAIGNLCNELGTGPYVASVTERWLSPALAPLLIFLVSCFISFSTGTSWGTFAIMISIAVPVANALGANLTLVVAAAMGGGVFGDHCSPISDTTIISSMASASDHIDHVRTQIPYAITAGVLTALFYIVAGQIM